jgi:hypothetical protein
VGNDTVSSLPVERHLKMSSIKTLWGALGVNSLRNCRVDLHPTMFVNLTAKIMN